MKQIRYGTFETNSSSTHAMIICTAEEFEKLCNNELIIFDGELITVEEARRNWNRFCQQYDRRENMIPDGTPADEIVSQLTEKWEYDTYDSWGEEYEPFEHVYKTPAGEEIVAFGYFGYDS